MELISDFNSEKSKLVLSEYFDLFKAYAVIDSSLKSEIYFVKERFPITQAHRGLSYHLLSTMKLRKKYP